MEIPLPISPVPDFSIVIVNMNAAAFLAECLRSIVETRAALTVQVILVDNGSTDGSLEIARQILPEITVLRQSSNIGYVPANNLGLRVSVGRYVMFLNNDTKLHAGCLPELARFLDEHPEAGVVSPQILNADGTDQGCARNFPSAMNGLFGRRSTLTRWFPNNPWSRRFLSGRQHQGTSPFEVEILSTACLAVRTDLAKKLNGMDEDFQMYWVCAEFCCRARAAGFKAVCVPAAQMVHYEGKGGSTSTFRQRCRMTIAFNRDAYLAYVKVHSLRPMSPRSIFAALALSIRACCLLFAQLLRPTVATSSGGKN